MLLGVGLYTSDGGDLLFHAVHLSIWRLENDFYLLISIYFNEISYKPGSRGHLKLNVLEGHFDALTGHGVEVVSTTR
jgi:hypothetical protein